LAAQYGHLEVVKAIMEQVSNKHPIDVEGKTPLHFAAQFGHLWWSKPSGNKSVTKTWLMQMGQRRYTWLL
jgi:ankyrin repeat protein